MNTQDANKRIRLIMHLRRMGITNTNVLSAIETVPRDFFVPAQLKQQAWEDTALPIKCGQTISQPYIVALMTQALELSDQDKVLEIGTGCGYQTAILAKLCRRVYTIERHKPLLNETESRLNTLKVRNVTAIASDGMKGWPTINGVDQAPFDKIIVTAAAREKPPEALKAQLKPGGLLVIPVGISGSQILKRYKKESEDTFAVTELCSVRFVPLLPKVASDTEAA